MPGTEDRGELTWLRWLWQPYYAPAGNAGEVQVGKTRVAVTDVLVVLGIFAGFVFTAFGPQTHTSEIAVLVTLPPSALTQTVIADSDPVLSGALRHLGPATSLASLRRRVQVKTVTSRIISISAQGPTATSAKDTANAVADSFVAYESHQHGQAQVLSSAAIVSGVPLSHRMLVPCGLGGLLGALIGTAAVIIGRGRRLRTA